MGAFLVPRPLLHRELRRSIALSLPLLDRGEDQPVLRAASDPVRGEELLFDLFVVRTIETDRVSLEERLQRLC